MRLTKDEFCYAINQFENMSRYNEYFCAALDIDSEWRPSKWLDEYFVLLKKLCDCNEDYPPLGNDLGYYCYELDFGHRWEPGCITIDGHDVPCRNAEELWDLLRLDEKKRKENSLLN